METDSLSMERFYSFSDLCRAALMCVSDLCGFSCTFASLDILGSAARCCLLEILASVRRSVRLSRRQPSQKHWLFAAHALPRIAGQRFVVPPEGLPWSCRTELKSLEHLQGIQ